MTTFFGEVASFIKENEADEAMKPYISGLQKGVGHLQQATMWLMQNGLAKPDNAGAASYDYMHMFGLVAFGLMWGKIAKAALARKAADASQAHSMDAKLMTGKFFFERMMPETGAHLARISTGADTMMAMTADMF